MIYNCNTFKFIVINSIIFDKCYYDFTMVSINLSNVIDILAMAIVPFWGILVFNLNGLPFWGDATLSIRSVACPFLGHPCFQLKWFALLGGCNIIDLGRRMSLFGAFLLSEKSFCRNRDIPWPKMAQNGPKWPKTA